MRRPVNNPYAITTEFGVQDGAARFGRHAGVDYAKATGSDVFAPVSGVITDYTWGQYHGLTVQIKGDDGRYHRMMHNSRLLVSPGQRVSEGQLVAKSGATGQGVTGPHVHWDISTEKIPSSFAAFISPASVLFAAPPATAPAPPPPPPATGNLAGRVVWLKPVPQWSVYRPDQVPDRSKRIGYLRPDQYNSGLPAPRNRGLTYTIAANGKYPNTVLIRTGTYGLVSIYLDGDAVIL